MCDQQATVVGRLLTAISSYHVHCRLYVALDDGERSVTKLSVWDKDLEGDTLISFKHTVR